MEMTVTVVRTITDLLISLGLATKQIGDGQLSELWSTVHALVPSQNGVEKYGEMLLDETDIEEALEELEGLVQEEVRSTVTQLLDIVYGLIRNIRVVMEGELNPPDWLLELHSGILFLD
jgi:hypothetical protein